MLDFFNFIDEKITLQYHDKLNQRLFDGDLLKTDVRNKLLEVAVSWQKFSKIPDELVKDVIFTGANANYNYTIYSDLDIHLVMDKYMIFDHKEYVDDYLSDKKTLWSLTRKINIKGYSVELYAQDSNDILAASGVYSLRYNKWLAKPIHGDYSFKYDEALEKKVDDFKDMVDNMIEKEASAEDFKIVKDKIKNMRKAALSSGTEFSFDNSVFKELRNQKVLEKMNKYLANLKDKELSLD
jgi:hypothetical protein